MPLVIFILIVWFLGPIFLGIGILVGSVFLFMAVLLIVVDVTNGTLRLRASEERREDAAVALGAWTFIGWLMTTDFIGDAILQGVTSTVATSVGAGVGFVHALCLLFHKRRRKCRTVRFTGGRANRVRHP